MRDDGKIFSQYKSDGGELWYRPETFHRSRVYQSLKSARHRAKKRDIPFDLTLDHLLSIFPKYNICPVLEIEMSWGRGSGLDNSPSLDRLLPEKGYVIGNVAWISSKANRIKNDATTDELLRVAAYLTKGLDCL